MTTVRRTKCDQCGLEEVSDESPIHTTPSNWFEIWRPTDVFGEFCSLACLKAYVEAMRE